jgi:hypothetical protein
MPAPAVLKHAPRASVRKTAPSSNRPDVWQAEFVPVLIGHTVWQGGRRALVTRILGT